MLSSIDDNFKKNIKKNIYAKSKIAKISFPPGFGAVAFEEAKSILANLWFAKKFTGEIALLKNEIQVRPVYILAIVELLLRNHCFSDVRLVIFKDMTLSKKAFEKKCREVNWDYYINKTMSLKIKVSSTASTAFHESGLKEIISTIINPYVKEIVSGENTDETTCLYVELYKNKLTISISLAGQPLYKRGYRGKLSASAPLREDLAACCIERALAFANQYHQNYVPSTLLIPFSGTGTFAFEYLQNYFQFFPAHVLRGYALEKMPLFKKDHFSFIISQAKEHSAATMMKKNVHNMEIICIDKSIEANTALKDNLSCFINTVKTDDFPEVTIIQDDFFNINSAEFSGTIFIPLNPPYGIRLGNETHSIAFYKKIAIKLNEFFATSKKNQKNVLGFVLCPNQETWSAFINNLRLAQTETYHFTQGGLDIRVCQFFV